MTEKTENWQTKVNQPHFFGVDKAKKDDDYSVEAKWLITPTDKILLSWNIKRQSAPEKRGRR